MPERRDEPKTVRQHVEALLDAESFHSRDWEALADAIHQHAQAILHALNTADWVECSDGDHTRVYREVLDYPDHGDLIPTRRSPPMQPDIRMVPMTKAQRDACAMANVTAVVDGKSVPQLAFKHELRTLAYAFDATPSDQQESSDANA